MSIGFLRFSVLSASAVLVGLLIWICTALTTPRPYVMPKWEYQVQAVPDERFTSEMNKLGAEGWELVAARRASDGSEYHPTMSYEMIFKRPMPPSPEP